MALPTTKLKDFSMTFESLLSALANSNNRGEKITDLAVLLQIASSSPYNEADESVRLGSIHYVLRPDAEGKSNEVAAPELGG